MAGRLKYGGYAIGAPGSKARLEAEIMDAAKELKRKTVNATYMISRYRDGNLKESDAQIACNLRDMVKSELFDLIMELDVE